MVEPRYLNFGKIKCGDVISKDVALKFPEPDKGIRLTDMEFPKDHFVVETTKESPEEIVLKVSTLEQIPLGRFSDKLTFKTSSEKLPEVTLSVTAYVVGDIEIKPERLAFFRRDEGEGPMTKSVVLSNPEGGGKFAITKVEFSSSRFTSEITEEEKGVSYKVTVTTSVEEGAKGLREQMTIYTNDPKQEKIQVPIVMTSIKRDVSKDLRKTPIQQHKREGLQRFDPTRAKSLKQLQKKGAIGNTGGNTEEEKDE